MRWGRCILWVDPHEVDGQAPEQGLSACRVSAVRAAEAIASVERGSEARLLGGFVWCTILGADVLSCAHARCRRVDCRSTSTKLCYHEGMGKARIGLVDIGAVESFYASGYCTAIM